MNTTQTTPPPPAADPVPPSLALPATLSPLRDRLDDLIEVLALDWDDPSLSAGRLCKVYHLKPEQLAAIARLPRFRATIAHLETVHAERTAILDARIREDLRAVLLRLIRQDPATPAIAKEIRLATKQLAALTGEDRPSRRKAAPRGGGGGADLQSAIPVTPPMKSADSSPPSLSPEQTDPPAHTQDSPSPTLQARQDPNSTPDPTPTPPPSGGVGAGGAAPTPQPTETIANTPPRPNPHKPKSPRGYKFRPKAKSR